MDLQELLSKGWKYHNSVHVMLYHSDSYSLSVFSTQQQQDIRAALCYSLNYTPIFSSSPSNRFLTHIPQIDSILAPFSGFWEFQERDKKATTFLAQRLASDAAFKQNPTVFISTSESFTYSFSKSLKNTSYLTCYSLFDIRHLLLLLSFLSSCSIPLLIIHSYSSLLLASEDNLDTQDILLSISGILRRISQQGLVIVISNQLSTNLNKQSIPMASNGRELGNNILRLEHISDCIYRATTIRDQVHEIEFSISNE